MRITLDDLTVNFEHLDRERLLDDWRWLIGPSRDPILWSAVGDAFVQDRGDGTIHFLDTAAGTCRVVAADEEEFRALVTDPEWAQNHLAVEVIADFLRNGLRLGGGQIYSWEHPPALGGEYEFENVHATDIAVHFSITGQIHEKIRALPPGTSISQLQLHEDGD